MHQTLWHLQDRDEIKKGLRLQRAVILIENGPVNRLLNVQARSRKLGGSLCAWAVGPSLAIPVRNIGFEPESLGIV